MNFRINKSVCTKNRIALRLFNRKAPQEMILVRLKLLIEEVFF